MDVRFFTKEECDTLQNAIHSVWSKNHILSKNKALLYHMFYDNPHREALCGPDNLSFLGLWNQNEVVGLLGVIPYLFNINGTQKNSAGLTNWVVNQKYLGGAGIKLLMYVKKYKPDMLMALGINQTVAKLYDVMRWNVLDDVPRWLGLCDKKKTIEKLIPNGDQSVLEYWPELKIIKNSSKTNITSDLNQEKWDHYYWNVFAKKTIGFARDYAHIKWRYIDHPIFDYQIIVSQDNKENYNGLAVVRIENILNNEHKIGRIVEFISLNESSSIALANEIVSFNQKILFWDFYSFSSITTWGLENAGFRRKPKWMTDKIVVPTRFQPLDTSITNMMASLYLSKNITEKFNYIDDTQWYVTKGDSDQDRPN